MCSRRNYRLENNSRHGRPVVIWENEEDEEKKQLPCVREPVREKEEDDEEEELHVPLHV